jgi:hypothetical protein
MRSVSISGPIVRTRRHEHSATWLECQQCVRCRFALHTHTHTHRVEIAAHVVNTRTSADDMIAPLRDSSNAPRISSYLHTHKSALSDYRMHDDKPEMHVRHNAAAARHHLKLALKPNQTARRHCERTHDRSHAQRDCTRSNAKRHQRTAIASSRRCLSLRRRRRVALRARQLICRHPCCVLQMACV